MRQGRDSIERVPQLSPPSPGFGKCDYQVAVGTPTACAVIIQVQTEEVVVERGVHGVKSNCKGTGDRGQAPEERMSSKESGRVMLKAMKPCVTASTIKESCVMAPEKGDEALCNGFEGKGVLCDGFGEERIKVMCDGFKRERESKMDLMLCFRVETSFVLRLVVMVNKHSVRQTQPVRDLARQKSKIGNFVLRFRGDASFVLQLEWKRTETVHESRKGNYGSAGCPLVAKMAANLKVRVKRSGKLGMRQCWNYHWRGRSNRTERRITRPNQHLQNHPPAGLGGRVRVWRI